MKRLTIAISVAAMAMPLFAQDKPNTTTTVLAQPPAPTQEDSPLVRAAKAANRLRKKPGVVITNETLAQTGGHMSTTGATTPIPTSALSTTSESDISSARAQADAKAKREAAAAKLQRLKSNPDDYMRENDVPPPVTAMSTTQPAVTSTSQDPAATNSQPASMSTSAPAQATTSQVTQMKTAQPETAATTKPPQ